MSEDESTEATIEAQETVEEDHVEITIGDAAEQEELFSPLDFLLDVPGLGKSQANRIIMMGYKDKESILNLTEDELLRIPDLPMSMANRVMMKINEANGVVPEAEEKEAEPAKRKAQEEPTPGSAPGEDAEKG